MKNNKNFTSAIVISVTLHLLLVAALLWGTDFNMSKPEPTGSLVQAVVIDPNMVRQQANEIRKKRESAAKVEQDRLDKLRKQAEQLEKNRKAEEARIRKLQEDKSKADKAAREAEKQRKAEQEKLRQEKEKLRKEKDQLAKAEAERKKKEAAVKKAEQERVAKQKAVAKAEKERVEKEKAVKQAQEKARIEKEKAAKAEADRIAKEKERAIAEEKVRKEQEKLKQLEKERKEQEAALGDIFAGLEQEASQNSSAKQKFVASEVDRYGAIYAQLIQSKLLTEESFRGKSCRVNLRLLPTGRDAILSDVKVLGGDNNVCKATKRAVANVTSFPLPEDKDVVAKLRDINLTVAPE
ncbi:protein TolA [Vibrio sp. MACH09]|uniref:cell envelope integrity protein TolA n=1 Tax=unclassified Vibrio TaxID=2614977 RepID=UPI001493CE3B|nr:MULTISPECIES: cell envelope integrity protein TolA [unclassified Vibrio]NOI66499.1 cell envelope integrity protein TolA [Vibrio sp. 99-8-1]GLO60500.1 protein TolA [Vibrio sp. MACH09]